MKIRFIIFIYFFLGSKDLNSMDENIVISIRHDQVMTMLTHSVQMAREINRSMDKINRCISLTACLCTALGLMTTGIVLSLKYCHS